jgi:hypothetical protein
MRIPTHPRFYVVSPCFAVAKVWRTTLDGNPTVFVDPVKVDLHDEKSNYCYADEGLINKYVTIWAAKDTADVIIAIALWWTGSGLASKIINRVDPTTLAQALAEAAISWPGYPYTDLNYTDMQKGSKYYDEYKQLNDAIQSEYG